MDSKGQTYLVPRNVVTRFQIFPGFGWFELGAVLGGAAVGAAIFGIMSIFTTSFLRFAVLVAPPGLVFFATKPGPGGLSFYDLLRVRQKWARNKKRYLYRKGW